MIIETHLVTVTPGEVLHTDVLVGVLGTLLERGHVLPVLPVLVPEVVGVDAAADQARNDGTIRKPVRVVLGRQCRRPMGRYSEKDVQDGELVPEACGAIELVSSSHGPACHQ